MFRGCTRKYGIFVPSFDVASSCSTTCDDASKRGGSDRTVVAVPFAASASHTLLGVRKPVTLMNARSLLLSVLVTPVETLSGRLMARRLHAPEGERLKISTRPFTFWSSPTNSSFFVDDTPDTD